jgi:hypothetical protein
LLGSRRCRGSGLRPEGRGGEKRYNQTCNVHTNAPV